MNYEHIHDELVVQPLTRGMHYWDFETEAEKIWNSDEIGYMVIWSYLSELTFGMNFLFN